jgi:hypothetical protein
MADKDSKAYLKKIQRELYPEAPSEQQVKDFLEAIGAALSTWQLVEQALYLLFERAVAPKRPGAAGCGFHALQFAGKLLVTDAAVRFALPGAPKKDREALVDEWDKLVKKARDRSAVRNHFAHFETNMYFQEKAKDKKVRLRPALFDFRYSAGLIAQPEYTLNDIRVNSESFQKAAARLRAFAEKIPPPK